MKNQVKSCLSIAALSLLTPIAGMAQTCPAGSTPIVIGGTTYCTVPPVSAPEISTTASIGGVALLLCGAVMLRRKTAQPAPALS